MLRDSGEPLDVFEKSNEGDALERFLKAMYNLDQDLGEKVLIEKITGQGIIRSGALQSGYILKSLGD